MYKNYYIFDTLQQAEAAELWIAAALQLPRIGKRQSDQAEQPGKQQTVNWSEPTQRETDKKYIVEELPDALIDKLIPIEKDFINNNYGTKSAQFDRTWLTLDPAQSP